MRRPATLKPLGDAACLPACAYVLQGYDPDPEYLGFCMAVSPHAEPHGVTIAVAAQQGRIACLTASIDADSVVQLSAPVVYAAAAPEARMSGRDQEGQSAAQQLRDIGGLAVLPAAHGSVDHHGHHGVLEHVAVWVGGYVQGCAAVWVGGWMWGCAAVWVGGWVLGCAAVSVSRCVSLWLLEEGAVFADVFADVQLVAVAGER